MPSVSLRDAAFLLIDLQNDFCPGGALAVPGGDEIVGLVNALAPRFPLAIATQDWHPERHCSFASSHPGASAYESIRVDGVEQTLWPEHCLQGGRGAELIDSLDQRPFRLIVRKGASPRLDSYSAFFENDRRTATGLRGYLAGMGVKRVFLAGLATDYCVLYSALDAVASGLETFVLSDATRAVDLPVGSGAAALAAMRAAGIHLVESREILGS